VCKTLNFELEIDFHLHLNYILLIMLYRTYPVIIIPHTANDFINVLI